MLDAPALLRRLTDQRVEFVVIGGLAMITHGSAHVTEDLDICYARTEANLQNLVQALEGLRPYLRGVPLGLPFQWDAATLHSGLNFTLTTDAGPLDLLGEVPGLGGYDAVRAQSEAYEIFGVSVSVLTLDGLIAAKKAAGRDKDQLHLKELEELKKLKNEPI